MPQETPKKLEIDQRDVRPDSRIVSVAPDWAAPEGTEVTYESGATRRVYKMMNGTWRYWTLT